MNLSRLPARNATSRPARSSSTNWNPPEVPTPGIAGGEKLKAVPCGNLLSCSFKRCFISWYCFAITPWLQSDKKESVVTGSDKAEQAEADYACGVLHAGRIGENLLNLTCRRTRARERRGIRKLHVDIDVAL